MELRGKTIGTAVLLSGAAAIVAACTVAGDAQAAPAPEGVPAPLFREGQPCDAQIDLAAPEVFAAIDQLPAPQQIPDATWLYAYNGNYNRCTDLSYAQVGIVDATGWSPTQLLLFHRGTYLGTATGCALHPAVVAETADSIHVEYHYPREGEIHAAATGFAAQTFRWWDGDVITEGGLPQDYLAMNFCEVW